MYHCICIANLIPNVNFILHMEQPYIRL